MDGVIGMKYVTVRVKHECWGCMDFIPRGTTVNRVTGVWDGRISSVYWCDTCQTFMDTLDHYDLENGFEYGALSEMPDYPRPSEPVPAEPSAI